MTANKMVRSIASTVYYNLKILIWAAYAYGIYYVVVGGHWGAIWDYITPNEHSHSDACGCGPFVFAAIIWIGAAVGVISSVIFVSSSIEDGEYESQWNAVMKEVKEEKISTFLGVVLGVLYILLVPYLLLYSIFYGISFVLTKKWIPKG